MVANNRSIEATFGAGKGDTFTANINGNLINSFLLVQANGGNGGDRLSATATGSLNGASFLGFLFKGGTGKDQIRIDATNSVNIGPLAQLTVSVDGGAGNDRIDVNYEGQLQGAFFLSASGGAGNDRVNVTVTLDGVSNGLLFGPVSPHTGKAAAQVDGGGGNDKLSFEVDLSGALKAASAAESTAARASTLATRSVSLLGSSTVRRHSKTRGGKPEGLSPRRPKRLFQYHCFCFGEADTEIAERQPGSVRKGPPSFGEHGPGVGA
jgi:hypothetical protein